MQLRWLADPYSTGCAHRNISATERPFTGRRKALLDKLNDSAWRANAAIVCREMATGPFDRGRLGRQLERLLIQVTSHSATNVTLAKAPSD